jgi:magnesium-transporting ATPase (P-type)
VSTAISSIPTCLPTFVQLMLASGAERLAESKAVVKTLTDVETLGATTVINSDKTGTLTMNAMTAVTMLAGGDVYRIEEGGYHRPAPSSARPVPRLPTSPAAIPSHPGKEVGRERWGLAAFRREAAAPERAGRRHVRLSISAIARHERRADQPGGR